MELDTVVKVKLTNIKWDTTDDEHPNGQDVELPAKMTVEVEVSWLGDTLDTIHGFAVDAASDQTDWLIDSSELHSISIVKKGTPR